MKSNFMKKLHVKIYVILLLAVCMLTAVGGSYAFLQNYIQIENIFNVKSLGVGIHEEFLPGSSILPGESIDKKIRFVNDKSVDLLIRVKFEEGWYDIETDEKKETLDPSVMIKTWEAIWPDEKNETSAWIHIGDYYYYKKILKQGMSTEQILNSLKLSETASNDVHTTDYSGSQYKLTVIVEGCRVNAEAAEQLFQVNSDIGFDDTITWTALNS